MRSMRLRLALALVCLSSFTACATSDPNMSSDGPWLLQYSEEFETPSSLKDFAFSDPERWAWSNQGGRPSLELLGGSRYEPPFRSPTSIALIPDLVVGEFDLVVDLLQTGRNYGHRDMCVFFGFQSPSRFYYVHLATTPDENAHNIFLVNESERTHLLPPQLMGVNWSNEVWHRIRIERRFAKLEEGVPVRGSIRVFSDKSTEPMFFVEDDTLDWGRVGFGSFDDSGRITSVRVWAPEARAAAKDAQPFEKRSIR